jgi:hypothetical protein
MIYKELRDQLGIADVPREDLAHVARMLADLQQAAAMGDGEAIRKRLPLVASEIESRPARAIQVVSADDMIRTDPPPPDQVIADTFDTGDKVALIAGSKMRKTFLLTSLCLHIAAGMPFLGWKTVKPRKILYVQLEVNPNHFHRRLKGLARRYGIDAEAIGDRLKIVNGRSLRLHVEDLTQLAIREGAEVIVFDPLYKLVDGDENSAEDIKPVLAAFDRLANDAKAAVIYCHHDGKGNAGDRNIRDRGAGSSVLSRDYDCCITLTAHRDEQDAIVVEQLLRNYKPQDPFTIEWRDGCFEMCDLAAVVKTGGVRTNPASTKRIEEYVDAARGILKQGPVTAAVFHDRVRTMIGLTEKKTRALIEYLLVEKVAVKSDRAPVFQGAKHIGLPEDIAKLVADYQNPPLPEQAVPSVPPRPRKPKRCRRPRNAGA